MTAMLRFYAAFFVLLSLACTASADPAAPTALRHYDFSAAKSASSPLPSDIGADAPLTFDPGPGGQKWEVVPGRGPGKNAVQLDQGSLAGSAFPITRAFTVEMWCRSNGMGIRRGNSGATNGMLIAAGDGYWHGWRLSVYYPEARVAFEIGRPQPSSSVNIGGGSLATGVWQHVAASWDGKTMRLFINGLPVASGPYDGVYSPPDGGQLKIGFADAGVGSLRLDVAEMTAYDQALDPLTLFEQANVPALLPKAFRGEFAQALNARLHGDLAASASAFRALVTQIGLPSAYRAAARLGLADDLQNRGVPEQAAAQYVALVQEAGVPDTFRQSARAALLNLLSAGTAGNLPPRVFERLLAMPAPDAAGQTALRLDYARSLQAAGRYAEAHAQYDRLLAGPELTGHDRWDTELAQMAALFAGGELSAGRAVAENLAHSPAVPVPYGSIALLAAAREMAQTRNYVPARTLYGEAAALPNAPRHQIAEARQGLKQVARLEAGKPAEDPTDSRTALVREPKPAVHFYVAPGGLDRGVGTSGNPFLTLSRARDAVRALRRGGSLPRGGVRVIVRGGEYPLGAGLDLTAQDSGTADAPVIYAAAPGETPIFTGAVRLRDFAPVTDPALLARLPAESRGHVVQTDLKAAGITDFGVLQPHGYGQKAVPIAELFFNGKPLTLARWPNTGFALTGKVTDAGAEGQAGRGIEFEYAGDRPARWVTDPNTWLYGYWYWDWADANLQVASIDPTMHRIHTTATPAYGVRSGQRFYAYNIPEEMDASGEWYLDRQTGVLLFYPPGDLKNADVRFSVVNTPLVTLAGVSHVTLRGLTLEGGRGAGATLTGCDHCLLAACTVRRFGGDAVDIEGGTNDGVLGCDLYTLGRGGVRLIGGDRKTLTPGRQFVENCDIHDFSRLDRTYTPAVQIEGVGNRIAHCHLHDAPHSAIRLEGNDHVIAFNEVDHVVTEADDQGGFDEWFNVSYRGNILRDNFWHDIGSGLTAVGQAGIRLDDAISGTLIYKNVFQRCSGGNFGGVQMNGGRDNWIDNNLFVDCNIAVSGGFWGAGGWANFVKKPDVIQAVTQTVDIHSPPYSARYPELAHWDTPNGVNHVWRNTVVNCGRFLAGSPDSLDIAANYPAGSPVTAALSAMTGFAPIPVAEMGLYRDANRASWPAVVPGRLSLP